jgi:hypothetical protein
MLYYITNEKRERFYFWSDYPMIGGEYPKEYMIEMLNKSSDTHVIKRSDSTIDKGRMIEILAAETSRLALVLV